MILSKSFHNGCLIRKLELIYNHDYCCFQVIITYPRLFNKWVKEKIVISKKDFTSFLDAKEYLLNFLTFKEHQKLSGFTINDFIDEFKPTDELVKL